MLYVHVHSYACRKDRRVFEAYQHEARAARDKKDKEEIEALRNEVSILCQKHTFSGAAAL